MHMHKHKVHVFQPVHILVCVHYSTQKIAYSFLLQLATSASVYMHSTSNLSVVPVYVLQLQGMYRECMYMYMRGVSVVSQPSTNLHPAVVSDLLQEWLSNQNMCSRAFLTTKTRYLHTPDRIDTYMYMQQGMNCIDILQEFCGIQSPNNIPM